LYTQKLQILNRNSISLFIFSNCEVLLYAANKPASSLAFRNWSDNSVSGSCITGKKFRGKVQRAEKVSLTIHRAGMIPSGNVIDAHAQHFVVNDEKLLLMQKLSLSELAHYKLLEMLDVFIVCLVVELSVASTNNSPVYSQQYAAPQRTCPSHA